MTWTAHQAVPFFGYSLGAPPQPPQMRHTERVDLTQAFAEAGDILEVFSRCVRWPDAQPFSGGVWDAWPARLAEGLAFCRSEWAAVLEFLKHEAEAKHHG